MTFKILTNALEEDPFALVEALDQKTAFLFDCGLKVRGNYRSIRKLKAIFITHAHIDHLIGFDHILRAMLSETSAVDIYGPPGFLAKMRGRILSYDWDRAHEQNLKLRVHEILAQRIVYNEMTSSNYFQPLQQNIEQACSEVNYDGRYTITWLPLSHGGSPCLGFALKAKDRWRIKKDVLQRLGLREGPWVGRLLQALEEGEENLDLGPDAPPAPPQELARQIAFFQQGAKFVYITDTSLPDLLFEQAAAFASDADLLICEGTFIEQDASAARAFNHLTARQAAQLAREANVKRFLMNHPSRRYHGQFQTLLREAREVFANANMVGFRGEKIIL